MGRDAIGAYDEPGRIQRRRHPLKISARNVLKGGIVEIVEGATTSHVRIDIGGSVVAASIHEAVAGLGLEKGKLAYAVINASDVMVGVD